VTAGSTWTTHRVCPERDHRGRRPWRARTYDGLRSEVEAEAASLDPGQWIDGEFVFDAWLSDSLLVGAV
jgi:hypothetical protein